MKAPDMVRRTKEQIELGLGEAQAFQKITQGLRWVIEGCTEIYVLRSDSRWHRISVMMEKVLQNANALYTKSAQNSIRGIDFN